MPLQPHRRSVGSRKMTESQSMTTRPSMHAYFNGSSGAAAGQDNDALEDNSHDEDTPTSSKNLKSRNRRASEGSHLIKGEGKKSASDLRCDTCGKGYKHSSCLTKHLYVLLSLLFGLYKLILLIIGGSTIRHGPLHRNSSSPNTSRCNCWRPLRFCVT